MCESSLFLHHCFNMEYTFQGAKAEELQFKTHRTYQQQSLGSPFQKGNGISIVSAFGTHITPPLTKPSFHIGVVVCSVAPLLPTQLPGNALGSAADVPNAWPLPACGRPRWSSWIFSLIQDRLLCPLREWNSEWKIYYISPHSLFPSPPPFLFFK